MQAYVEIHPGEAHSYVIKTDSPQVWPEGKRLSKAKGRERLKAEAIAKLRDLLKPGMTILCVLRHVSQSGMSRRISFFVATGDPDGPRCIDSWIINAGIGDEPRGRNNDGVSVGGCGMDMGFHVVYNLGRTVFPDGFGEPCRSEGCEFRARTKDEAAHCNEGLREGVTPHEFCGRNGDKSGWDNDGGYALKHRWI